MAEIAEIDGVGGEGEEDYYDEEDEKEGGEEEEQVKEEAKQSFSSVTNSKPPRPQTIGMVDESNKIKLVLVGDTSVGKSCLVTNYLFNSYEDDYEPTVLDVYKGVKNVQKH